MTDYGRGPGSQPWHPEDPLYGDQGWDGSQAAAQQSDWDPYQEQYQQRYQGQQQYPGQPYQGQQYPHPQQPYPGQQGQYGQQGQPYYQDQQPHYGDGGWDTGGHQQPYGAGGGDPYGQQSDPYGHQPDPYGHQPDPYGQADPYGTGQQPGYPSAEHAYAQPAQPHPREDPARRPAAPDPETGWDPGADQGEHAFFAGRDDDDDGDDDSGGPDGNADRRGRNRRGGGTKRKGGCACLIAVVGLAGGLGTIGYFGYQFYESRFGDAPDFSGAGRGTVQVEVPEGSSLSDMGNILKKAGVVKSHDAFVEAADENGKSASIHAGVFTLKKEMSASAALEMMLDPASQSGLIVPEGLRATQIYELIDKKLEKKKGTTKQAASSGDLGLPEWAGGNPEGLLFPAKYTLGDNSSPESVLKDMVKRAESEFQKAGLESGAGKLGKSPKEIVAIASLIQAEAQEDADFGKVSRVIYNRLESDEFDGGMALQFDSTINYAKGESKLNTTVEDTKFDSPYNTYIHKGLPPGPIDNPGHQALKAALHPSEGNWLYFVSVKPGDTRFTDSHTEHEQNVQDFNEYSREKGNGG